MIFKHWRFVVGGAVGALLMFAAMQARVWLLNASHALKIENVKASLIQQCEDNQNTTERFYNELETQNTALNRRVAELVRLQRNVRVTVTPPSTEHDGAARPGHADNDGITAETLYTYAGTAERYRQQLIACQSFINHVWEEKHSP